MAITATGKGNCVESTRKDELDEEEVDEKGYTTETFSILANAVSL